MTEHRGASLAGCLICRAAIAPFLSFGRMPIANGFLTSDQFADEFFFELKVGLCPECGMVQLTELVDRERMFHERYPFFSSTSRRMVAHFEQFARRVRADFLTGPDPFVVELGSNDGIMLEHFAAAGIRHLGVEPAVNVAQVARAKGVRTICRFFEEEVAGRIVAEHGQADVILGANVLCHIPYLHSVLDGIAILLKPGGVALFEDPYLGDIVAKTSYDQIYDEHAFYFTVASVGALLARHGFEVIDVQPQEVHGGSMRYTIAHQGVYPVSPAVSRRRRREEELGLRRPETFARLRADIERSRDALVALLEDLKRQGRRVAGYAATSKSTTVINYCGLTPELVESISDTTPIKQGKFSPGQHIPVVPHETFRRRPPDYALLFGWNHAEEILAKEQSFRAGGGRFIGYVPQVGVMA